MTYLYAIISDSDNKLRKELFTVNRYNDRYVIMNTVSIIGEFPEFKNEELSKRFDYVDGDLGVAYNNGIDAINMVKLYKQCERTNAHWDIYTVWRNLRCEAASFNRAIAEICKKYDVVAYSHRKPGWLNFNWTFDDKIRFLIKSNFGYGNASYFCVSFYYNDVVLAPYSFYVKYRFSDYASVIRCTREYNVSYDSWNDVMDSCMNFYDAIVHEKDSYIFRWLNEELENMVTGLENIMYADSLEFWNLQGNRSHVGTKDVKLTDDDMWVVKSKKIAFSLDFVDNIQKLPQQVHPDIYVQRLKKLCEDYKPLLEDKINSVDSELTQRESELESLNNALHENKDFSIYESLRTKSWKFKWYKMGKWERLRHLIALKNRLPPNTEWKEVRGRKRILFSQMHEVQQKENDVSKVRFLSGELHKSMDRMM